MICKKSLLILIFVHILFSGTCVAGNKSNKIYGKVKFSNKQQYPDAWVKRTFDNVNNLSWPDYLNSSDNDFEGYDKITKVLPFWGSRGRRDRSLKDNSEEKMYAMIAKGIDKSDENNCDSHLIKYTKALNFLKVNGKGNNLNTFVQISKLPQMRALSNNEVKENDIPFWGSRGRRPEYDPFSPKVINSRIVGLTTIEERARILQVIKNLWKNYNIKEGRQFSWSKGSLKQEDEPLWANRERRQDSDLIRGTQDPVWVFNNNLNTVTKNQDASEETEPFWGNRGRREETQPFWDGHDQQDKIQQYVENANEERIFKPFSLTGRYFTRSSSNYHGELKKALQNAIDVVENHINKFTRSRRNKLPYTPSLPPFWVTRGRDSQLQYMLRDNKSKNRLKSSKSYFAGTKARQRSLRAGSKTVLDGHMFVEQPSFILIERSSRSSSENDPFYIARGKKENIDYGLSQAVRGRRGAIEKLVKSVQSDPFYVARGKKDKDVVQVGNITSSGKEIETAENVICTAVNRLIKKVNGNRFKRELSDERERRMLLKKLATQLNNDVYFVSRGKKNQAFENDDESLLYYLNTIYSKCN